MDHLSAKVDVMDRMDSIIQLYKKTNANYLSQPQCATHIMTIDKLFENLNNHFSIPVAIDILYYFTINCQKLSQINKGNQKIIDLIYQYVDEIKKLKIKNTHPISQPENKTRSVKVSYV